MTSPETYLHAHPAMPAIECPRTHLGLEELAAQRSQAFVRDGRVLDLATTSHYWNHLTEEQMVELLRICRESGWRQSIDAVLRPEVDDYTVSYVVDPRRADGIQPLLADEPMSIVDVGAGWGAVTCSLASQGHAVAALDSNGDTLEFLSLRADEEGYGERVRCVRVDPLELAPLPIADGTADLVLLNGVLEWVGAGVDHGSPRDHQLAVLRDVRRVLAPEGRLYLAIESRWGISMWLGAQDHPQTKFTSVVPRWVASWMTRRAGKGPYRTWTYGYHGLRGLLREAGLTRTRFSCAYPDYRFPHSIVPIEDRGTFRRNIFRPGLTHNHARLLAASARLGLHRDAVNHYLVVASR